MTIAIERAPNWFRWLLVLPAAASGLLIGALLTHFIMWQGGLSHGPLPLLITQVVANISAVWCSVELAAYVAPRSGRRGVYLTLAWLLVCVFGAMLTLAIIGRDWSSTAAMLAGFLASIAVTMNYSESYHP